MNNCRPLGCSEQRWGNAISRTAGMVDGGRLPLSVWRELVRFNRCHNDVSSAHQEKPRTHRQHIEFCRDSVHGDISGVLCVQIRHWSVHRCTEVRTIHGVPEIRGRGNEGGVLEHRRGMGNQWHQWINVNFIQSICTSKHMKRASLAKPPFRLGTREWGCLQLLYLWHCPCMLR